jgi:Cu(I)/Ag(I) efflux system periplasmic protein CusF
MKPNRVVMVLVLSIATAFSSLVHAQAMTSKPMAADKSAIEWTDAEVRKVDKANKTVVLKHGEVKSIGMPGMTMMWQVADPALLDKVKPGEKVRFRVAHRNGTFVVSDIQPAK